MITTGYCCSCSCASVDVLKINSIHALIKTAVTAAVNHGPSAARGDSLTRIAASLWVFCGGCRGTWPKVTSSVQVKIGCQDSAIVAARIIRTKHRRSESTSELRTTVAGSVGTLKMRRTLI